MSDTPDTQPTLSDTLHADTAPVAEKAAPPAGWVVVRLVTELGEADIAVPPKNKWGSMARNRLTQGDDLGWAAYTLLDDDVRTWSRLDPDLDEVEAFFERFDKAAPQGNNRAERRRHLRAAS